jgi:two-component system response regulator DegU
MDNGSKTLLKGLLAVLSLFVANEQLRNTGDTNRMLLMGIMSVLTLVFSSDEIVDTVQDVNTKKYFAQEGLSANFGSYENTLKMIGAATEQEVAQSTQSPLPKLTPRESEVLNGMAEGLMNKDIAKKLFISDATVKNHVTSVLRKLNAAVRTEAVVTAIKCGLLNATDNRSVS